MRMKKDEIHPDSCLVCNVHVIFLSLGFFIVALLVSWAPSALAIDDFNLDFEVIQRHVTNSMEIEVSPPGSMKKDASVERFVLVNTSMTDVSLRLIYSNEILELMRSSEVEIPCGPLTDEIFELVNEKKSARNYKLQFMARCGDVIRLH